ncbi:heavy metal-binding domain-containing protein, partial [Synechococcus sp. R60.4]
EELEQRAKRLGANGILGVSIHTNMSATMILVTAAGTAVKLR